MSARAKLLSLDERVDALEGGGTGGDLEPRVTALETHVADLETRVAALEAASPPARAAAAPTKK